MTEVTNAYRAGLKNTALQFLPKALDTVEGQKRILETLGKVLPMFFPLDAKAEFQVWRAIEAGERKLQECVAELAKEVNDIAGQAEAHTLNKMLDDLTDEQLMMAWIHLDFYGYTMKKDNHDHIVALQDAIARVLMSKGHTEFSEPVSALDQLQVRCYELQQKDKEAPELKKLLKKFGDGLLAAKELYVALDPHSNNRFPYVGMDGHMEVFTVEARAHAAMKHFAENHQEHFNVAKIEQPGIKRFFEFAQNLGIPAMRVNNGFSMVNLWFKDFFLVVDRTMTELRGRTIRNLMLRDLQASARMRAMQDKKQAQERYFETMLTMRANAYREFGNGLAYVFVKGDYKSGVTLYTKAAMDFAKKVVQEAKLPEESLVAPGDQRAEVYGGALQLRAANKPNQKTLAEGYLCAFTDRRIAELARQNLVKQNCNDCVVLVTIDELLQQAQGCAGLLVDMGLLGYEIPKERFQDLLKWRQAPGFIMAKAQYTEQ